MSVFAASSFYGVFTSMFMPILSRKLFVAINFFYTLHECQFMCMGQIKVKVNQYIFLTQYAIFQSLSENRLYLLVILV